MGSWNFVTMTN